MTVTASSISLVSKYTVSESGPFTTTIFNGLLEDAKSLLAIDDPGLPSLLYDRCLALLICHLYETRDPEVGLSTFKSGDISATRHAGQTVYLIQYQDIIDRYVAGSLTLLTSDAGTAERCDADIWVMALDDCPIPEFPAL